MLKLQLMLPTTLGALMSLSTQAPALGPATDVLLVSATAERRCRPRQRSLDRATTGSAFWASRKIC
jgi:hypothetical protein